MRQTLALFFIGLIALSSVSSLNQDVQFLQSLKSSEFGSTLFDSMQVQLQSGTEDSVDKILDLLKKIADQIVSDQKADDAQIAMYRSTTKASIARLNAEIKDLTAKLGQDRNLITANNAAIKVAQGIIKKEQKHKAADEASLQQNRELQAETTKTYKEQFAKLSGYVAGLTAAKKALVNYQEGQSFLEVTQGINSLNFEHPKFQGFMNILSEMLSSSERVHGAARFQKVLDLIDQLTEQIIKEIQTLTRVYNRRMADLKVLEDRLETEVATHAANIARQEVIIGLKRQSTAQAETRITAHTQRRAEATQEGKDLSQQLADANSAYASRTSERKEESAIIARVQVIFQTRLTDEVRSSVKDLTQ